MSTFFAPNYKHAVKMRPNSKLFAGNLVAVKILTESSDKYFAAHPGRLCSCSGEWNWLHFTN